MNRVPYASPMGPLWSGREERRDLVPVEASPEQKARIAYLFGRTSPGPKPIGKGAAVPDHTQKKDIPPCFHLEKKGRKAAGHVPYVARLEGSWIYAG